MGIKEEVNKLSLKEVKEELNTYNFPVPPVCTRFWNDWDWLVWAMMNGKKREED